MEITNEPPSFDVLSVPFISQFIWEVAHFDENEQAVTFINIVPMSLIKKMKISQNNIILTAASSEIFDKPENKDWITKNKIVLKVSDYDIHRGSNLKRILRFYHIHTSVYGMKEREINKANAHITDFWKLIQANSKWRSHPIVSKLDKQTGLLQSDNELVEVD